MRLRISDRTLGVGIVLASMTVVAGAAPSSAHGTCTAASATFVQAVGFPSAPVLVPMNLPATVCTLPTNVRVVAPAFQIVGFQAAPVIVPRVASCTSRSTRVVSVTPITAPLVPGQAAGTAAPVAVTTLSGTAVTPLIVCF